MIAAAALLCAGLTSVNADDRVDRDFRSWTLEEAVGILNDSPWARQETYTRIIGGIGSGLAGEKEIYSTFFVRILSARPVREAYARVRQIQAGYDQMGREEKKKLDSALEPGLKLDVTHWIVVAISFRSNDPNLELRVKQFLETQTTDTMKPRAHLSTAGFPRLEIAGYFPPEEEVVGAKFVFPRAINRRPVASPEDPRLIFELDVPGFDPELRATFSVAEMLVGGKSSL